MSSQQAKNNDDFLNTNVKYKMRAWKEQYSSPAIFKD